MSTLEVLTDLQSEVQAEVDELVAGPLGAGTVDRLQEWSEKVLDSGWPRLELELALAIRDDQRLVTTEGDRNRDAVGGLGAIIADRLPLPDDGPISADVVAEMIVNLAFGIAVRRVVDPRALRYQAEGVDGMVDRNLRPQTSPKRTPTLSCVRSSACDGHGASWAGADRRFAG